MAAIAATLVYLPACVALGLGLHLLGVPVEALATLGGAVGVFTGLALWWLAVFAGACVYGACLLPWGVQLPEWPRKR